MAGAVRDIIAEESLTASWIRPESDAASPASNDWGQFSTALTESMAAAAGAGSEAPPSAGADGADATATAGAAGAGAESDAVQHSFNEGQLNCAYMDLERLPQSFGEQYGRITIRLDLSNNCLRQVPDLTEFAALQELVLDNNDLDDTLLLPPLPRVHTLSVNKNRIRDLDGLLTQIARNVPSISFLSLLGNEACPNELVAKDEDDYQRYRHAVLFKLPGVKFLDSRSVTAAERQEAKRVGAFTKVARFTDDEYHKQNQMQRQDEALTSEYRPLSKETREPENHKATFGQSRFAYYGRHSEGNRFIRNSDL